MFDLLENMKSSKKLGVSGARGVQEVTPEGC